MSAQPSDEKLIERFQSLSSDVQSLNNKIVGLEAKREMALQRQAEILKRHGVKNVAELEAKYEEQKRQMRAEIDRMQTWLTEVTPEVERLEEMFSRMKG